MKIKTLTLASVAGSLALTGAASATFTGLAVTSQTLASTGGASWDVFELYVTFDSSLDQAVAMGGTPMHVQTFNTGGGGFFQATIFGSQQNVPNGSGASGVPNIALDSFLSVGTRQLYTGPTPALPTIQFFNLTAFNGGASSVVTSNGGWFVAPSDSVSNAVPFPPPLPTTATFGASQDGDGDVAGDWGVIIGQFTVASGNTFSGDLGALSIFEGGVNRIVQSDPGSTTPNAAFSFTRPLPAPGALALLGLAGLAGTRRRRS